MTQWPEFQPLPVTCTTPLGSRAARRVRRRALEAAIIDRMRETLPPASEVLTDFRAARSTYTEAQIASIAQAYGVRL